MQARRLPPQRICAMAVALAKKRWSVRARTTTQFCKQRFSGRSGIECRLSERNLLRRENDELTKRKIHNRRRDTLRRCDCNCSKDLAALGRGRFWLRLGRLGMKWALALSGLCLSCGCADRTMIGNREPRGDRDRDDQATRGCSHADSIADGTEFLKCFLFDP